MHPMLNIAVRAARSAGTVISRAFEESDKVEASLKGTNDFVTNIDRDAERAIIEVLRSSYPEHTIVSEEAGELEGTDSDYQWIVDPIDGTTNFLKGIPHFCVSIALRVKGKLDQAVIYDPIRNELFSASRGNGAQLNGRRLRVTKPKEIEGCIFATGFPFKYKHHTEAYMSMLGDIFADAADIRRGGSAALDLAYVAAGRIDGYWEIGLKPWDIAAGELIVKEAGGLVCDFTGDHNYFVSGNIVAAGPRLAQAIVKTIRPSLTESLKR